jgi:hypothetical protein
MCHNYHGEVPLVVTTSRSFPHSWFIIGFVTIVTHDGFHQWSRNCLPFRNTCVYPWCFSGVRVIWSLVLSVMFCRSLFVLLSFLFWPCVVFSVLLRFTDSDYRLSVNMQALQYKEQYNSHIISYPDTVQKQVILLLSIYDLYYIVIIWNEAVVVMIVW